MEERKNDSRIFGENVGLFPEGAVGLKAKRKPSEDNAGDNSGNGGGFGKDAGLFASAGEAPDTDEKAARP